MKIQLKGNWTTRQVWLNSKALSPSKSQKIWNHSPDGFNWGYIGSGPAQLALAILYDVTKNREASVRLHQKFKFDIISGWGDKWEITESEVREWLINQQ